MNHGQISLDCAVVRQALADLRAWNKPVPEKPQKRQRKKEPYREEPERLTVFKDAARWAFDEAGHGQWHFSLAAICARLDLDVRKVRANMLARLTANQHAWLTAVSVGNRQARTQEAQ